MERLEIGQRYYYETVDHRPSKVLLLLLCRKDVEDRCKHGVPEGKR